MLNFFLIFDLLICLSSSYVHFDNNTYDTKVNIPITSVNSTVNYSRSSDYIFDTPDIVKEYIRDDGIKVRLDAYKTKNNAELMQSNQFSGLRWFSLGQPEIVKINQQSIFGFQKLSFWLEFEMLTSRDKEVLADEVKRAKGFSVDSSQFSDMDSNTIECFVELYDIGEQKISILKGKAFNLKRSPYKVEFKYPVGSRERNLFDEELKDNPIDLEFKCTVTAGAQIQKSNTFTITLQESNNIKLVEKIFGPANESYVARDQLTQLSNEIDSYFNVVENYQVSHDQFSSIFVENLITLTGQTTFKPVSFDDALKSLSKYSIDIAGDLNPNQIKKEISELFKVEKFKNMSHIVFDEKYYKELEKQSSSSGSGSGSVSVFGIGGGQASAQYTQSKYDYWLDKGSSLDDQLNELNTYSENKIKYEFEGNKIVPKSLVVSKLQSSSFKKTLSFSRIKNFYYEADYNQVFTLNTLKHKVKKERKYPNYSIVMIGSEEILKFFDSNGKGFGEYIGWFLCDGRNGTPNLRGKFVVGRDEFTPGSSYSKIGMTGGTEYVRLSTDQIPSHSHQFQATTSSSGSHSHRYMDVTYADGCDFLVPMYRGIRSGTAHNRAEF